LGDFDEFGAASVAHGHDALKRTLCRNAAAACENTASMPISHHTMQAALFDQKTHFQEMHACQRRGSFGLFISHRTARAVHQPQSISKRFVNVQYF
jgi:hypothetical protein